jgi:hypothetical protein
MLLCGLAAATVLWQSLSVLVGGMRSCVLALIAKILTAVMAAGTLALTIILTVIANINIATFDYYNSNYALYLSAGSILLMLFALVLVFLPNVKKKQAPAAELPMQSQNPIPTTVENVPSV